MPDLGKWLVLFYTHSDHSKILQQLFLLSSYYSKQSLWVPREESNVKILMDALQEIILLCLSGNTLIFLMIWHFFS